MKKGKTSKIIGFRNVKVLYGTVDALNLKSVYLNLQTWVEPKKESSNWQRVVLNKSRQIRHTILMNSDKQIFDDKFIVDMDLRSSGLVVGKKSFMNLEVTLFFNQTNLDFKSKKLKETLKKLSKVIIDENLTKDEHFKLHLRKTNKKIQKGEESQDI
jgi:hypothetical protein